MDVFVEFSLIMVLTVFTAAVMHVLKQPLIISYILAGILAGPHFFNWLSYSDTLAVFSHIGIALLLFIVGLNLNPSIIKDVGKVSLITGIGQVLFTSIVGYFIGIALGFDPTTSLYLAIALSFSSTIIIMKLLSDKEDVEKLYGRISMGFLIVQDLIAIIILMVISSLKPGLSKVGVLGANIFAGVVLIVMCFVVGYLFLPSITRYIAKSQELLMLFAISWALLLSSLFFYFGFSIEVGALIAGVTLSLSPYRFDINHKMRTLRDFFIVVFFILLGSQLTFSNITAYIVPIVVFSLFVLVGNPLIVMILMGVLGYSKRNGFLSGLTVAQISEFSLILVALGVSVGHVTNELLSLMTTVGLITIAGSSYMVLYADKLYKPLSKYLSIFERSKRVDDHKYSQAKHYDVIMFGYNHPSQDLIQSFKKLRKKCLIIDYNPETVVGLAKQGMECRYGDANDPELLDELDVSKTKMIVSMISHFDTNALLVSKLREINENLILIVAALDIDEAIELYKIGATYVVMPSFIDGEHTSTLIEKHQLDMSRFVAEQVKHIEFLHQKKRHRYEGNRFF